MTTIRRGTPLLLVAVALLLTFTGSATATRLVTGAQVRDGSVLGKDVRDRTVTGRDVRDGTLELQDVERPAARYLAPEDGPVGPVGPMGPEGPVGVKGLRKLHVERTAGVTLAPGSELDDYVYCPDTTKALSGGHSTYGEVPAELHLSVPTSDGSAWRLYASNESGATVTVFLWAVCASG